MQAIFCDFIGSNCSVDLGVGSLEVILNLNDEKNELIEIDSKYYETEKKSNEDLDVAKNKLKIEIDKVRELINARKNEEAIIILDSCKIIIEEYAGSFSANQNIKKGVTKEQIEEMTKQLVESSKVIDMLAEQLPDAEGTPAEQLKRIEELQEEHEKISKELNKELEKAKEKLDKVNAEFEQLADAELKLGTDGVGEGGGSGAKKKKKKSIK